MKQKIQKIMLSALLSASLMTPTITALANEEMVEVTTEASTLTTPEDFYKLGLTFKLTTASSSTANDWTTREVPIDSKVQLFVAPDSNVPGMGEALGTAYIDNINDLLPPGYVQFSSSDKFSSTYDYGFFRCSDVLSTRNLRCSSSKLLRLSKYLDSF